jgi:hypothetical protein
MPGKKMALAVCISLGLLFHLRGEDLTTLDGRTFREIRVLSVGLDSIRIVHTGGLVGIKRGLLPTEFNAAHPPPSLPPPMDITIEGKRAYQSAHIIEITPQNLIRFEHSTGIGVIVVNQAPQSWRDYAVVVQDQRAAVAAKANQTAPQQPKRSEPSADDPALKLMQQQLADHAKKEAAQERVRMALEKLRSERLARSHDGLFILAVSPYSGGASITLLNVSDGYRTLNFHLLRGRTGPGQVIEAGDVRFDLEEIADYSLSPGKQRRFNVIFPSTRRIAAVSWADRPDDWFTP